MDPFGVRSAPGIFTVAKQRQETLLRKKLSESRRWLDRSFTCDNLQTIPPLKQLIVCQELLTLRQSKGRRGISRIRVHNLLEQCGSLLDIVRLPEHPIHCLFKYFFRCQQSLVSLFSTVEHLEQLDRSPVFEYHPTRHPSDSPVPSV